MVLATRNAGTWDEMKVDSRKCTGRTERTVGTKAPSHLALGLCPPPQCCVPQHEHRDGAPHQPGYRVDAVHSQAHPAPGTPQADLAAIHTVGLAPPGLQVQPHLVPWGPRPARDGARHCQQEQYRQAEVHVWHVCGKTCRNLGAWQQENTSPIGASETAGSRWALHEGKPNGTINPGIQTPAHSPLAAASSTSDPAQYPELSRFSLTILLAAQWGCSKGGLSVSQ